MSRYIDADVLCEALFERWHTADKNAEKLIQGVMAEVVTPIVAGQPHINIVPCKECRHKYQEPWHNGVKVEGECEIWHNATLDDDFCSYGERKSDE